MQLYIRGAWRTFSRQPDGRDFRKNKFLRSAKYNTGSLSCNLLNERSDQVPSPLPEVIVTGNLSALQTFYLAFTDSTPLLLSRIECHICLENKKHIVLVDERSIKHGESARHLPKSVHENGENHRSSEQKTISLESASIESFLASYRRLCGRGIFPVQTFIGGASVAMVFEDPDGNLVVLKVSALSFVKELEVVSKDLAPELSGGGRFVDHDVVYERIRSWNDTLNAEGTGCEDVVAGTVKSEPFEVK